MNKVIAKGDEIYMTQEEAYKVIEDYYYELHNYSQDSNWADYDIDMAYTKEKLEKVISEKFELTNENIEILNELLFDNNDIELNNAIKVILNQEYIK